MPNRYESGDEAADYITDEEYYSDPDTDYQSEDNYDGGEYSSSNEIRYLRPVSWKKVKLGQTILEISDEGAIKPSSSMFQTTKGYPYLGTPYRTFTVQLERGEHKEYFVHDLVWRAFHGEPPEGWEVRHTYEEACRRRKYYSNSLRNLTITPITVEQRPTIFI